ncbi:MAG: hypothetical protein QM784_21635 [Polyangiaceae bacterium]
MVPPDFVEDADNPVIAPSVFDEGADNPFIAPSVFDEGADNSVMVPPDFDEGADNPFIAPSVFDEGADSVLVPSTVAPDGRNRSGSKSLRGSGSSIVGIANVGGLCLAGNARPYREAHPSGIAPRDAIAPRSAIEIHTGCIMVRLWSLVVAYRYDSFTSTRIGSIQQCVVETAL